MWLSRAARSPAICSPACAVGKLRTGELAEHRQQIDSREQRRLINLAGGDLSQPARDEEDADAAFEKGRLVTLAIAGDALPCERAATISFAPRAEFSDVKVLNFVTRSTVAMVQY